MITPATKIQVRDTELKRVQDNITRAIDAITRAPIIDGRLVPQVAVTGSFANYAHGLGRKPLGYIVVSANGIHSIFEDQTARTSLFLNLRSSYPVTVDLWVF